MNSKQRRTLFRNFLIPHEKDTHRKELSYFRKLKKKIGN